MKRHVFVAKHPAQTHSTVHGEPATEGSKRKHSGVVLEHPVSFTDPSGEAVLLTTALSVSQLEDSSIDEYVVEIFTGSVAELIENTDDALGIVKDRTRRLKLKLEEEHISVNPTSVEGVGEFLYFILQSVIGVGSEFRPVCMDIASRAFIEPMSSIVKKELALCVPVSIRKFNYFRNMKPEKPSTAIVGYPTHWLTLEFYLDDFMEKNFQISYARVVAGYAYSQCIIILVGVISMHFISNQISHRFVSSINLVLTDPSLILGLMAIVRLVVTLVFFSNTETPAWEWFHRVAFGFGLSTGISATLCMFYFSTWLAPAGWGFVTILGIAGFMFSSRFIHSLVVCSVLSGIACRFIWLRAQEDTIHTAIGQTIFSVIAAVAVTSIAYVQEKRYRNEFRLAVFLKNVVVRNDELLGTVIPDKILRSFLQRGFTIFAENYEDCTIMFVDIVGFTEMASSVPSLDLVAYLSSFFVTLEEIASRNGMQNVKTIGDALMTAIGLPSPIPGHASAAARCALEILQVVSSIREPRGNETKVRIGLHSGPCTGGVASAKKLSFDIWGDTVHIANQMQLLAKENTAVCSQETADIISDDFDLKCLGFQQKKGKGRLAARTYQIVAERPNPKSHSNL